MSNMFLPRGRQFVRSIILNSLTGGDSEHSKAIANGRWGDEAIRIKASVSALTTGDIGTVPAREFLALVSAGSITGKLSGMREVDFGVRTINMTSGAAAYWTAQNNPKPLSKPALQGSVLYSSKVIALIAVTDESIRIASEATEQLLQNDLTRAVSEVLDWAFIDPGNGGIPNAMPAAITSGVTPIAATSNPADDITALIESFTGDLASAHFVTDPATAVRLALSRDGAGSFQFQDVTARGGSLVGIPLITSRSSPTDSNGGNLALVDASGIAFAMDGVRFEKSNAATLMMSDSPSSPAEMVSLFQTNTTAFLAEIFCNWSIRAGAVQVLTGAHW